MTDKQRYALLSEAIAELKLTKEGYPPKLVPGTHWAKAMPKLNKLAKDLKPPLIVVPVLGPVWMGGKSVLTHDLTHATTGIPLFPAFDDAFKQGTVIIAPEDMEVIPNPRTGDPFSSANPGEAFYSRGKSKIRYWFGHLDRNHKVGTTFKKGDAVGKVAANLIGGGPHVHVGVNIELLVGVGKELVHHTNYTHGAPLIGVQLKKLLAA